MIVFAVLSWGGMDTGKIGKGDYQTSFQISKNAAVAFLAMGGGIVGLVISVFGCCAAKQKNFFVTCPFVVCSFLVGLMALIAGGMVVGGKTRDALINKACNTPFKAFEGLNGNQIARQEYGQIVDKVMCTSDLCPCDDAENAQGLWKTKAP